MYKLLTKRHQNPNDSKSDDSSQDADSQQQIDNEGEDGIRGESLDGIAEELSNLTTHNGQESVAGVEVEGNGNAEALERGDLMNKSNAELKEMLKSRGMKLTGKRTF
jgi:hypothetical protein